MKLEFLKQKKLNKETREQIKKLEHALAQYNKWNERRQNWQMTWNRTDMPHFRKLYHEAIHHTEQWNRTVIDLQCKLGITE